MDFVYPADMLKPRLPDEMFREEADALKENGHLVSLLDPDTFSIRAVSPSVERGTKVVYRGWMVKPTEYQVLVRALEQLGAVAYTSLDMYLSTHYLPNWYPILADLTPETVILDLEANLVSALKQLGWPRFFVKDYVKSLKTAGGSLIDRPEDIERVVAEMQKYRGEIEGGLCVRRYEDFVPNSEVRFFVIGGMCFGADPQAAVPPIVQEAASRLSSPFFTVDMSVRTDGTARIVEVGDGQVSDLVGWTADRFAALWR